MMIKSWSYSKLLDFEQCKLRFKMRYLDRIQTSKSEAADRGTMIHQLAEDYVRSLPKMKKLPIELKHFSEEFDVLRREYKAKRVSLEGEWGFDKDWLPTPYNGAWLRMKADASYMPNPSFAIVVDYKTGASWGNEIKHGEQVQLYAIATFIRNPALEEITVELWYLDKNELVSTTYTRAQALRYVQGFDKRATKLVSCQEFPPNPNQFTCKWCDYGPQKGKQCPHGVAEGAAPQAAIQMYRQKFG